MAGAGNSSSNTARGLWYDAGGGDYVKVLEEPGLRGAFVEREDGSAAEPGASGWTVQYWFFVPEDAETFYVDIIRGSNRVSIWDPEGGPAWDMQGGVISDRAEIEVEPGHAGRLWRITLPRIGRFRLDERIPPVLAVNPERWFMPDD